LYEKASAAPADAGNEAGAPADEKEVKKPTLNAAVSDKALTVHAVSDVGIKAIYINGYEFKNTGNGNLKIKLQQFDAGYNKFYIYAEDNEGNTSDLYEVENPYFDEDKTDDKDPSKELPVDANATDPVEAVGTVEEHLFSGGREFYTIATANGKVFYLIVDMLSDEEKVYFLTEISERDLMNATNDQSETLPRNSAVPEDGIPEGAVIVNNNVSDATMEAVYGKKETVEETTESDAKDKKDNKTGKTNLITKEGEKAMGGISGTTLIYVAMGVICVAVIFFVTSAKKKKRNKTGAQNIETVEETDEETEE
jgi:hypothetical protein